MTWDELVNVPLHRRRGFRHNGHYPQGNKAGLFEVMRAPAWVCFVDTITLTEHDMTDALKYCRSLPTNELHELMTVLACMEPHEARRELDRLVEVFNTVVVNEADEHNRSNGSSAEREEHDG